MTASRDPFAFMREYLNRMDRLEERAEASAERERRSLELLEEIRDLLEDRLPVLPTSRRKKATT